MNDEATLREIARARTRSALRGEAFMALGADEQRSLFRNVYEQNYRDLANSFSAPGSQPSRAMASDRASDMINEGRHSNPNIEKAGDIAGDFMQNVDFPGFVRDLLKGVFDANLEVTVKQMETFKGLLQAATQNLSSFVRNITDDQAMVSLADKKSDDFTIDFPEDGPKDENGQPRPALIDARSGEKLDLGDNELKAKIMDTKIQMAREQRALLREVILMGVTRLVVERGQVKASVVFDIKASEKIERKDKAALKSAISTSSSLSASGGFLGAIFGGPQGGTTRSSQNTRISISTTNSTSSTDLSAKVMGSVDIVFKSDYFKLDNFAQMYGPGGGDGANVPQTGGAAPRPAPAPAAPPGRT
jgi:hypothetical protein